MMVKRDIQIIAFLIIVLLPNSIFAFNLDGLESGMLRQEAIEIIKKYKCSKIIESDTSSSFLAYEPNHLKPWKDRLCYSLSFCGGRLVQLQKNLEPRFEHFVRLVNETRDRIGKPDDAWSVPASVLTEKESNTVKFLWINTDSSILINYSEWEKHSQLSVVLTDNNECFQFHNQN
jgi:hypothetical protein